MQGSAEWVGRALRPTSNSCRLRLGEDSFYEFAVDVGEAETTTLELVGQSLVIDPE